jgi:hypothetical protein
MLAQFIEQTCYCNTNDVISTGGKCAGSSCSTGRTGPIGGFGSDYGGSYITMLDNTDDGCFSAQRAGASVPPILPVSTYSSATEASSSSSAGPSSPSMQPGTTVNANAKADANTDTGTANSTEARTPSPLFSTLLSHVHSFSIRTIRAMSAMATAAVRGTVSGARAMCADHVGSYRMLPSMVLVGFSISLVLSLGCFVGLVFAFTPAFNLVQVQWVHARSSE